MNQGKHVRMDGSLGEWWQDNCTGTVLAVMQHAVYLRTSSGTLIPIVPGCAPAAGVGLPTACFHALQQQLLPAQVHFTLHAGQFSFAPAGSFLCLTQATLYYSSPLTLSCLPQSAELADYYHALWALQPKQGLPPQLSAARYRLAPALEHNAQQELADTIATLGGLGPGLTPLGDDILLGVLWARNAFPEAIQHLTGVSTFCTLLRQQLPRLDTTVFSRFLLHYALQGAIPELVRQCLVQISAEQQDQHWAGAQRLAALGATSGLGMLQGLLSVIMALHSCG